MFGIGTLVNTVSVAVGGIIGTLLGNRMKESYQVSLKYACGVGVIFMSIASAMENMLKVKGKGLVSGRAIFIVLCLAIGVVIGEIIGIERGFERFGEWLKIKSGSSNDNNFVNAFLTASYTVCIGAMAIIGAIKDGMSGDYSVLITKSVIDFATIIVLTCSLGKGAVFSAIPIFVFEGGVTLLAKLIKPIMTDTAMDNLSLVGAVLIFLVGVNLVWDKKIRVANFLPALILAVGAAFLPWQF